MSDERTVICLECKRTQRVSISQCLRSGWPVCHGATVMLVGTLTQQEADVAVSKAISPVPHKRMDGDVERDFIAEAFAIAEGHTMLVAERAHIQALVASLKSFGYGSAQEVENALLGR